MSDTHQAIYDAVRSRISNGDVGAAVLQAAHEAFDISHLKAIVQQEAVAAFFAMQAPHVLVRPALFADGTAWCALYGENLQEGVSGFGNTPAEAMAAFDKAWREQRTPAAMIAALSPTDPRGSR